MFSRQSPKGLVKVEQHHETWTKLWTFKFARVGQITERGNSLSERVEWFLLRPAQRSEFDSFDSSTSQAAVRGQTSLTTGNHGDAWTTYSSATEAQLYSW
jgi:hypothetical protein